MPVIQLANSKLSLRTYEPPPANFDPLKAKPSELLLHGFPDRPDPKGQPELFKRYQRAFSRKTTYILPEFRMIEGKKHGPRVKPVEAQGTGTSTNWSGSVVFAPGQGDKFSWVEGQWTVPNPYAPAADGWYYSSQWVGIDGDGSNDVLQAGTETEVQITGGTVQRNVYPWWEWFPEFEIAITNVPVAPGDVISCLICATSSNTATIFFRNQSNSVSTSFSITAPQGTTLKGNCAEWIVERPTVGGQLARLADYDVVYFDDGIASWRNGNTSGLLDLGQGTFLTMTGNGGKSLSVPTDETAQLMKMTWEAAS